MTEQKSDSKLTLKMRLMQNGISVFTTTTNEPVEIGRRQAHELPEPSLQWTAAGDQRFVVAALELRGFPRQLLRIEIASRGQIKIGNLHHQAAVKIANGGLIGPLKEQIVPLPVTLALPENLAIEFEDASDPPKIGLGPKKAKEPAQDDWTIALNSLCIQDVGDLADSMKSGNGWADSSRDYSLTRMANDTSGFGQQQLSTVLTWLEQALAAMQRPASSSEFYAGIAEAVARIIDVDRAEIILWDGKEWLRDPERSFVHPDVSFPDGLKPPANSLLNRARSTRRMTIHPEPSVLRKHDVTDSVMQLHAAVACPILDIFGGGEDILGVLYADRQSGNSRQACEVMETEQKLIAILATAIASSIAKEGREKLVTKYQQFFSSKVTEAIRLNPGLLDGEDANVTVLFCDIRRFSHETDRIGAAAAMRWVSDTLSELSEHVLQLDGVLVDYVGDEMFAMWGAPEKTEDHAMRAVSAANEMIKLRQILSDRYSETLPNGVDFGIGICTGTARVGNTGSKQKFKYGPLGRTVNLGSRLQGLTKQWKVCCVMDAATERDLPTTFLRRRLCQAQVVGMEGSTALYELMPENDEIHAELAKGYAAALELFESGTQPREAARAYGELVQRFPQDGPSLIMLVRAVNELVHPSVPFSPVWSASTK
ncbi:MAG: adenylate/guanylate cyclase domain-containing protein [Pirellulaceae bacterium]|nr:adenylate/guanylate cyclase domain-containing protein [Pirellulaceae bacterium]